MSSSKLPSLWSLNHLLSLLKCQNEQKGIKEKRTPISRYFAKTIRWHVAITEGTGRGGGNLDVQVMTPYLSARGPRRTKSSVSVWGRKKEKQQHLTGNGRWKKTLCLTALTPSALMAARPLQDQTKPKTSLCLYTLLLTGCRVVLHLMVLSVLLSQ